ncbi:MAG: tRNA uridine-5-carboxymethylaminomethyl(34) synthesis GTPase MnmE [Candidatus Omnitrophota bacterium]
MKNLEFNDTIAAISTPPGEGGIGIVRLSGNDALKIVSKIFVARKNKKISSLRTYTIHYGYIVDKDKNKIDEVILSIMRSPRSYTREDVVEINCHSGIVSLKKILDLVLDNGARLAEPGEFTKRAFLNGRIDIMQAEAVLDIIRAKTELSLRAAINTLEGNFSKKVNDIREELLEVFSILEASIDFIDEEDVPRKNKLDILKRLNNIKSHIVRLVKTAKEGKVLRQGIKTVICGSPNVGKSSLMNALLKDARSIVTHIPGTTRDTIEEIVNIKGIPIVLVDTAGINDTDCPVEKEGVRRSHVSIENSDFVLMVLDHNRKIKKADLEIARKIKDKQNIIIVINKKDLKKRIDVKKIKGALQKRPVIYTSAINMSGIDELEEKIKDIIFEGNVPQAGDANTSNDRQISLLKRGLEDIEEAINLLRKKGIGIECVSLIVRSSLEKIGEITGHTLTEKALDRIFSEFCIGK